MSQPEATVIPMGVGNGKTELLAATILAFVEEHYVAFGVPPSVREIGDEVARSNACVHRQLRLLVADDRLIDHGKRGYVPTSVKRYR